MQRLKAVSVVSAWDTDEFTRQLGEQMDILGSDPDILPSLDYRTDVIGNKVKHSAMISWWEWVDFVLPAPPEPFTPDVTVTRDSLSADWVVTVNGEVRFHIYADGSGVLEV